MLFQPLTASLPVVLVSLRSKDAKLQLSFVNVFVVVFNPYLKIPKKNMHPTMIVFRLQVDDVIPNVDDITI